MNELSNILWTKLKKPPITKEHVNRDRLVNIIENNIHKPLSLISAPAGYGKSTLISSALEKIDKPYVWVSVDQEDNDFRTFLEYLCTAIDKIFPNKLDEIWNSLHSTELPPIMSIATILINCLDETEEDFLIVIDDYHFINDNNIHKLFDVIIKYPPENLHLIILTRKDPPLKIHLLKARSGINEIRMEDLCFLLDESRELFLKLTGIELSEEIMRKLYEKTEGWVVGLYLASISVKSSKSVEKLLKVLEGGILNVTEFLVEEVIKKQTPKIQEYLVQTSILTRVNEGLAEVLSISSESESDHISGEEFTDWVLKANLFTIPLDDENIWFRYHHLFQESLQRRLEQNYTAEQINEMHSRAAKWFADHGYIDDAIKQAVKCGAYELAVEIILKNHVALTNKDRWYQVERWLNQLPQNIIDNNNKLLLLKSWIYFYQINFVGMQECLASIEKNGIDETDSSVLGEVNYFYGYISFFSGKGSDAVKYFGTAIDNIPDNLSHALGESELHYCLARQMVGEKNEGIDFVNNRLESVSASDLFRQTRLRAGLFFSGVLDLDFKLASYQSGIVENIGREYKSFYAESWGIYVQALMHLNRGKFDKAIPLFEKTISNEFLGHSWVEIDSFASLLLIYQIIGQHEKQKLVKEKFSNYLRSLGSSLNNNVNYSIEARVMLLQGNKKGALDLLEDGSLEAPLGLMLWWTEVPNITECRVLIAESTDSSLQAAVEKLSELEKMHTNLNHYLHHVNLYVLLSIAYIKLKEKDLALTALEKAVEFARPSKIALPFIENSEDISVFLKTINKSSETFKYVSMIFNSFDSDIHKKGETISSTQSTEYIGKITNREIDVLKLLAEGLRNKEIAEKLFLSNDTIKKHVYNIFQKIGAKNRLHAITIGKQRGII